MGLGLLALAVLGLARADEAPQWRAEAGIERMAWLGSVAWNAGRAQAVGLRWRPAAWERVELGLGGRIFQAELVLPLHSWEAELQAVYAPRDGRWYRPAVGLELGWSGAVKIDWEGYFGPGWREQDPVGRADYAPWFLGLRAEPLCFAFGPVLVSAGGLSLGSLAGGRVVRARLSLVQGGVQW
jgi:hypothetical protein